MFKWRAAGGKTIEIHTEGKKIYSIQHTVVINPTGHCWTLGAWGIPSAEEAGRVQDETATVGRVLHEELGNNFGDVLGLGRGRG